MVLRCEMAIEDNDFTEGNDSEKCNAFDTIGHGK